MNRSDLENFRTQRRYFESEIEYLQEKRSRLIKITQFIDGMPHGKNHTNYALENWLDEENERLTNLAKKENEELENYEKLIFNQLNKMKPLYATILHERYIQGKKLEDIAEDIHYNYYDTCKKNGEALNEFDRLDEENETSQQNPRNPK